MTDLSRSRAYNWRGAGLVGRALLHTPYHPITLYQRPQSFYPRSIHFAMQNPPPDQESLPEPGEDTSQHLPCITVNHLFQIPTGSGWQRTGKNGKRDPRSSWGSTRTGVIARRLAPTSSTSSPTSYRSGRARAPSHPQTSRFSSPRHMTRCTATYCVSTSLILGETPKERSSLGSPVSVRHYGQNPTPYGNSSTHRRIRSPGKTTFQWFVLTNLISAHQVVLFCNPIHMILFFCGRVYIRLMTSGFDNYLPKHSTERYCPIWALIDMNYNDQGPSITGQSNIWPIQMSSPSPIRWKSWQKRNKVALWGMPLWNEEELTRGYVFGSLPRHRSRSCHSMRVRH